MISEYKSFGKYQKIVGLDEAGRGPIAGPVVAAAVILHPNTKIPRLNDSKKLSASEREKLFKIIIREAVDYSISAVDSEKIDQINILQASFLAMQKCLDKLEILPDYLLVDGPYLPTKSNDFILKFPAKPIIRGDGKYFCIAAASILAKVYRDNLMMDFHEKYPQYDFKSHKGYPTKKHIEAINNFGISPIHRKTFAPVRKKIKGELSQKV
ncbi:MAG: ribonuclease HII [Candidatus Cloacimonadota bacterium]|nr:ribonuclease HII [Candidatus Cloacimonadota bacterium]